MPMKQLPKRRLTHKSNDPNNLWIFKLSRVQKTERGVKIILVY